MDKQKRNMIKEFHKQGMTQVEIANLLEVSQSTVSKVCHSIPEENWRNKANWPEWREWRILHQKYGMR